MRVLLTGATGFIGSHVARRIIADGHQVVAVVRPQSSWWRLQDIEPHVEVIQADAYRLHELRTELERAAGDVCIHLAWDSTNGWSAPNAVECAAGSLISLRAVLESGCKRLVVAGSAFEYEPSAAALNEDSPVRPQDLYGAAKHAVHVVATQLTAIHGASLVWLRIFNVYGPYDDERRLVPSIVKALLRGECAATTRGEQIRDFVHVEDVAAAICHVAGSSYEGPINIASGVAVSVSEVATLTARQLGMPGKLRPGALPYPPGELMSVRADVRRLRETLGWAPRYDLESGLAQTVRWLAQRYAAPA